jgi:8-oxo-dGTP diphosphatase
VGRADDLPEIRAAGGLVWRRSGGRVELLVVHRPRYGDWSFPKGKRDGDERDRDTALREVREETGLRCRLGPELGSGQRYEVVDRKGRSRRKRVRWWAMTVDGDGEASGAGSDGEVDRTRWSAIEDLLSGADPLTYDDDLELVHLLVTSGALEAD